MKRKLLTITMVLFLGLSTCMGLSSCGSSKDQNDKNPESSTSSVSSDAGKESEPVQDSQTANEFPTDTVPVYLLSESYVYMNGEFHDHYVCERNQYGNVVTRKKCKENSYDVISTDYNANVTEEEGIYHIDTPYTGGIYYHFYFDENGNVRSIVGRDWTLTYSDDDNAVFQMSSVGKSGTTISKYDEKYRRVERIFYAAGSSEPTSADYYTYDDRDRIIQSRSISYKHNYDFDNTITLFCEMDHPLVNYWIQSSNKNGYEQKMTEYTCECTYDDSGNVITEIHKVKENDKIDFYYEYAYDSKGNMIERKEIEDGHARNIYEYDADGNQIGYRLSEGESHDIYKPFPVKNDPLVLAFLALREETY